MVTSTRPKGGRVDGCYAWPDLARSIVGGPLSTNQKIGLHSH